jgi:hypothetical protein
VHGMDDVQRLRIVLCEILEQAAIWRSLSACDSRCSEAAKTFRRLIATVDEVEDQTLLAYCDLWEGEPDRKAHADLLETVGYGFRPCSASDFVARFIAERSGGLQP